jgi:hypothetical protein
MWGKSRTALYVGNRWGYDRLCTQIPARYLTGHAMLPNWHLLSSLSLHTGHAALLLLLLLLLCVLAIPLFEG